MGTTVDRSASRPTRLDESPREEKDACSRTGRGTASDATMPGGVREARGHDDRAAIRAHRARPVPPGPLKSITRGITGSLVEMKNGFVHHPVATSAVFAGIVGACYGLSKTRHPSLAWLLPGLALALSIGQIAFGLHHVAQSTPDGHREQRGWETVGRGLLGLGLAATGAGAGRLVASSKTLGAISFLDDAPVLVAAAKNATPPKDSDVLPSGPSASSSTPAT